MARLLILLLLGLQGVLPCSKTLRSPRESYVSQCKATFFASIASLVTYKVANAAVLAPSRMGIDKDGSFSLCPPSSCVSSQDDRPAFFVPPWEYDGIFENTKGKLVRFVSLLPNCKILSDDGRYIRFIIDKDNGDKVDDLEFFFPLNDSIIQYRSLRRGNVITDFGENRERIETIRKALKLDNIAVLRNRRRMFIFGESPFDTFGPPTSIFEDGVDSISGDLESSVVPRSQQAAGVLAATGVIGDTLDGIPLWETKWILRPDAASRNYSSWSFLSPS